MFTKQENGDFAFTNARRNAWGTIDCDVTIETTGEVIPFTATPYDPEEYGVTLYNQLNTTYSSQVADCPEEERYESHAHFVRRDRNRRLKVTDWTQQPDVPEATRTLWQTYRQALRDVPVQTGFPYEITWPTPPA
jgi:hypothetical protein